MRSLSDTLNNAYRSMMLQESTINEATPQKALRLFGYATSTEQRYVCCLATSPRIDVHKYKKAKQPIIMCLITDANHKIIDSAIWYVDDAFWNRISFYDLKNCSSISELDERIQTNSKLCNLLMRYRP